MFRFCTTIFALLILSCSTDAENILTPSLGSTIANKEIVVSNVIACAASDKVDKNLIRVFFYPRKGATNFKYYETIDSSVDKDNFENYVPFGLPATEAFNGFLKKFEFFTTNERWAIVTFDEGGKTHISNPIRLKQNIKPTEYLPENINVDASTSMPNFSWQDGSYTDSKIYFQVVSDSDKNLLSGTYTFEKAFQYYKLDNVVLNITVDTPPALIPDVNYGFSLLAVSEDNWVNQFSEVQFSLE